MLSIYLLNRLEIGKKSERNLLLVAQAIREPLCMYDMDIVILQYAVCIIFI